MLCVALHIDVESSFLMAYSYIVGLRFRLLRRGRLWLDRMSIAQLEPNGMSLELA